MGDSYRKSDSAFYPGKVGRKTGFQVTWTPRRGANGLEDPKEFFLSDDEFESQETTTTSPVKRLSMRFSKLQELRGSSPTKEKKIPQLAEKLEEETEKDAEGVSTTVSTEHRLAVSAESNDKNSDIDSDMDIDEVIKRAEDVGTPIRIPHRTLTSITGSPASNSNSTISHSNRVLGNTFNSSKLTKNIALNKNTKNSKFQPQDITNAEGAERTSATKAVLETISEDDKSMQEEAGSSDGKTGATELEKEGELKKPSAVGVSRESLSEQEDQEPQDKELELEPEQLSSKSEFTAEPVKAISEEPTEKLFLSQRENFREKESSPQSTQVISQPSASPNEKGSFVVDEGKDLNINADKTSDDIRNQAQHQNLHGTVNEAEPTKSNRKPRLQPRAEKAVTTTDIVEFIISKDDQNNSMQERKANNLLRRKAAMKSYSTSQLVTSGSEHESSDELSDNNSTSTLARKSKSMDHASITPKKTINSKVSKLRIPPKPKVASKQNSRIKSAQPATPIRRSTRTRVPPIASWKNEKILYKTEKVNGVIVKTVDNVLHRPDALNDHATPKSRRRKIKSGNEEDIDSNMVKKAAKTGSVPSAKEQANVVEEPKKARRGRKPKILENSSQAKSIRRPSSEAAEGVEARAAEKSHDKSDSKKPARKALKRKLNIPTKSAISSRSRPKIKKQRVSAAEKSSFDQENSSTDYPPAGWQGTSEGSLTLSIFEGPGTEKQVERTVAYAPGSYKNVTIIKSDDEYFKVGTLFDQDCEFCGGGIIELPSGARKAVKSNHDTYFIFYVITGEVEVTLSRNTFTVTEGCSFEIPMGNYYQFVNTGGDTAKMMFVQAKYIVIGDKDSSDSDDDSHSTDHSENGNESSGTT